MKLHIAVWCVLLVACGDSTATPDAASNDAGSDAGPAFVLAEPALPVLTPCPAGWAEVPTAGGPTVCEPWPDGGHVDCAGAEAHFPGEPGCMPVGRPCPADGWPADLPADRPVTYVRAGAIGGDGTREQPFGTIAAALAAAPAGSVVAIGRGEYDEQLWVMRPVTLRGACAAETTIRVSESLPATPAVSLAASGAALSDVTVGPSTGPGVGIYRDVAAQMDGVAIAGVTGAGLFAGTGSVLEARDVLVRGVTGDGGPDIGAAGVGLAVSDATVTLSRASIEDTLTAVVTIGSSTAVLEDTAIRDVRTFGSTAAGHAIEVFDRSRVEARRTVVEQSYEFGIFARGEGPTVLLEDCVVRDTQPVVRTGVPWRGRGLIAFEGADAVIRRSLFERNHQQSIQVRNPGSELVLEDTVIRDTIPLLSPSSEVEIGTGLRIHFGATARVARAYLERNVALGISIDFFEDPDEPTPPGTFTTATLEDVVVRDTMGSSIVGGRAVQVGGPTQIDVTRMTAERSRGIAVLVGGDGAVAVLRDLTVLDTGPVTCGVDCEAMGVGVGAYELGTVDLTRFRIERSQMCGVQVASDRFDARDGVVTQNTFGACVQVDGYDVARLSSGVMYYDNETNLESTTLPVPAVAVPGE